MAILRRLSTCTSYTCSQYKLLESSLSAILSCIKPVEDDRIKRLNTVDEFTSLVNSMDSLKDATVKPFGSFVSNLFTKTGDLDLSVELPCNPYFPMEKNSKLYLLLEIMKTLQNTGGGRNFGILPLARVPVLIFQNSKHNIDCDVTVNNPMAILKTHLIHQISEMDWRFRDLVLLIKEWANAYDINDAKQKTLSSFSIYLLVMFHFQTCKPAILPPLKEIYPGNVVNDITEKRITERYIEDTFAANIASFKSDNKSSLQQLFLSFFEKFSNIQSMTSQYAISTYTGRLENILSKPQLLETSPFDKLIIEDPFKQQENAACAVGAKELVKISNAFTETHEKLTSSSVLSDRDYLLGTLVRPKTFLELHACAPQDDSAVNV